MKYFFFTGHFLSSHLKGKPIIKKLLLRFGQYVTNVSIESHYYSTILLLNFMKTYCPFILDIKFTIKKTNNTESRQAIESINSLKCFNINDESIDNTIIADVYDNFWEPILFEIPKAVEGLDLYNDDNSTPRIEDFSVSFSYKTNCYCYLTGFYNFVNYFCRF